VHAGEKTTGQRDDSQKKISRWPTAPFFVNYVNNEQQEPEKTK
jgi:hypothetical protein